MDFCKLLKNRVVMSNIFYIFERRKRSFKMVLIEGFCCLYGSINKKTGMIVWPDAYKDNDEFRRPLMWNHEPRLENLIGKVILENRGAGVYCVGILEDETLLEKYPKL